MDSQSEITRDEWNDEKQVEEEDTGSIATPFDPREVRIERQSVVIPNLRRRLENNEINLQPKFQRFADIWTAKAQSQLIESLLIKVPLPAFYMDARDDECWDVIDGLQRITTIKKFILDESLRLSNLEFLVEYNGCTFSDLPRTLQRRIDETELTFYLLRPGTPEEVMFNIFKRVNTGGAPLNPQEIRHALYQGAATSLLESISEDRRYRQSPAALKKERMADRELILRGLSFLISPYGEYNASDLDAHLNSAMKSLNRKWPPVLDRLQEDFFVGLERAQRLFGDHAFRKPNPDFMGKRNRPLSKSLFEALLVSLARAVNFEILMKNRKSVIQKFVELEKDSVFMSSITQGTYQKDSVVERFSKLEKLFEGFVQ